MTTGIIYLTFLTSTNLGIGNYDAIFKMGQGLAAPSDSMMMDKGGGGLQLNLGIKPIILIYDVRNIHEIELLSGVRERTSYTRPKKSRAI
jgi:hypothetical protein